MAIEPELNKTCVRPNCPGEATIISYYHQEWRHYSNGYFPEGEPTQYFYVQCGECSIRTDDSWRTPDIAIEEWNKR